MSASSPVLLATAVAVGGGILCLSASWKIRRPAAFQAVLKSHGLRAQLLLKALPVALPAVEGTLGVCALISAAGGLKTWLAPLLVLALIGQAFLGITLTTYVTYRWLQGVVAPCGCLNTSEALGPPAIVRSLLVLASGLLGYGGRDILAAAASRDNLMAIAPLAVIFVLALVVLPPILVMPPDASLHSQGEDGRRHTNS